MSKDLINHLTKEQRKREEEKKIKQDNYELSLKLNDTTTRLSQIPNMRKQLEKVREKSDITFNQDYERLTNSNFKYKWEIYETN